MKLENVRVQNFKIVEDSTSFTVGEVACLVGKNEAGKSAILQALYKLNPVEDDKSKFNETEEYPRRRLAAYRDRAESDSEAAILTTEWQLEDADISALKEHFGFEPTSSRKLTISKGYDNERRWSLTYNEAAAVKAALAGSSLNETEKDALKSCVTIAQLVKSLDETPEESEAQTKLITGLKVVYPHGDLGAAVRTFLSTNRFPKLLYFSDYYRMPGKVALSDLQNRQNRSTLEQTDKVFLALLDLAKTSVESIQKTGTSEEFIAELESVSNRLTDEIFEFWSQNSHLVIKFRCDQARANDPVPYNSGFVFSTRVENQRHRVSVNFDDRSTGFIWFFSFLVWFSQVRKQYGKNLLILLDEPGLNLHATAQRDLLRYINERLKPSHQVIYTTHSPFMVDPENLLGVRTVEDRTTKDERGKDVVEGTKVGDRVFSTDADTILPLQGALGYDITQTLFVGANTLLVEGPADVLFIKAVSNELAKLKRAALDLRWTLTPAGGLAKVSSFVTLFSGKKVKMAVVCDIQKGDKAKAAQLRQTPALGGKVFTLDAYTGQEEADIEDMIGRENYFEMLRQAYGLKKGWIPAKKPAEAPARCLKEAEDKFRIMPEQPEFDHYRPAQFFMENAGQLKESLPDWPGLLDRFEALFKDLNEAL